MDLDGDRGGLGLTNEQTSKILQFQDLTGIDDMTICRDVLQRHRWNLEIAIQEQLNMREGRPSLYATEARPPAVVRDHIAQQIFSDNDNPDRNSPGGIRGLFNFIFHFAFSICFNLVSSIPSILMSIFRGDERRIVTDPVGDVMSFINSYSARYSPHPVFYQGTYSQALNDAKQELRFLLVYLHSDNSAETPNFCRYTLSDSAVIQYINQHTLMWGCCVESGEGWRVAQSVGAARKFPLLCVVALRESRMTIVGRIEGACSARLLLDRLRQVLGDNETHLQRARADRVERSLTATLRAMQDEAYEESLKADQEKERLKQEARKEEMLRLQEETDKVAQEEKRKNDLVNSKIEMASRLPTEPDASDPAGLAFLIKLPCGTRIQRRFSQNDNLEDVYNYVFSHPLSPEEFEITTNFPKRVLDCASPSKSLAEAGLKNRDVLFVSDCNA